MPALDVHCHLTTRAFGQSFEHVHRWLNEFAGKAPYGMNHRRARHHLAGIEDARALFGEEGAEVARMHIELDLMEGGWDFDQPFPRNEAHFVSLGYT